MAGTLGCCLMALIAAQSLVDADVSLSRPKREESDVLKVTTIAEPPYVIVKDPNGKGNDNYKGFMIELLQKISEKTKFTYLITLAPDGKYGAEQTKGQWSGMIGEVMKQEADLAAAPMTVSAARREVIDFTEPYMTFHTTILMKKSADTDKEDILSVEDLVNQSEVKYGLLKDGITENFFKYTSNALYRNMWRAIQDDQSVVAETVAEGVQKVRDSDGKYAFIMESSTAEYWVNRAPCNLRTIGRIRELHYGLGIAKGSSLKMRLNSAISALVDSGEIDRLKEKWWKGDQECSAGSGADPAAAAKLGAVVLGLVLTFISLY